MRPPPALSPLSNTRSPSPVLSPPGYPRSFPLRPNIGCWNLVSPLSRTLAPPLPSPSILWPHPRHTLPPPSGPPQLPPPPPPPWLALPEAGPRLGRDGLPGRGELSALSLATCQPSLGQAAAAAARLCPRAGLRALQPAFAASARRARPPARGGAFRAVSGLPPARRRGHRQRRPPPRRWEARALACYGELRALGGPVWRTAAWPHSWAPLGQSLPAQVPQLEKNSSPSPPSDEVPAGRSFAQRPHYKRL
ncbi:protein enabled homolog [Sarcophilus harrisii]|uniref:protein enabled homolog n=1 Tax=Sarcophilus harrisii TaxID=9305 RepID=UPI001301E9D9|nr:protein enabled homolog [Sarcophilus harrisii]